MAFVEIKKLSIEYQKGKPVLHDLDLSVEEGELLSLLGPSGCGKTTTLRAVAGFIEPTHGEIIIDGQEVSHLPPDKRDIGLVFQSYALFPHMTVFDNVAFGLKMRKVKGETLHQRVEKALEVVNLEDLGKRKPGQLSGGQRQRVALARAIVIEPKVMLYDEPLSNLDAKLRVRMRAELRRLQQLLGITAIYVTHDQVEALAISDRIAVMNEGILEQVWSPKEIFTRPGTPFVASFMGFENRFEAKLESIEDDRIVILAGSQQLSINRYQPLSELVPGEKIQVFFRPEAAEIANDPAENSLPGTVIVRTFQGSNYEYIVKTALGEFLVHFSESEKQAIDDVVHLALPPTRLLVLPYTR